MLWKSQNIPLNIIYNDNYLLIINKSSNLVVHPGNGNLDKTLFNALLYYYPFLRDLPRAGIIHRLDKNTTGLIIIAKTMLSYINLKIALKKHKIIREYEAIVNGIVKYNDIINYPIKKFYNKKNIRMNVTNEGKEAITQYFLKRIFKMHSHLKIKLHTGRTHQIRVHLEYINHSIVGDPIYNKSQINIITINNKKYLINKILKRQALHACRLEFMHPIYNYPLKFNSSLPNDIKHLISILEKI
ncbi:RluA family pseudouridine synthase [Enterobacteriaceae endosymbiont of Plateumaris braccata]|uniref:RluA family pseudouridine synthase n=1 Tax=Enterobacteriaceae endosymbiont of Plateumaris braccata TaxID=2675793 RepID=UPI001FEC4D27|nr:RluA family pseudouridine synthase [Enterobacteriaceae endosymbiont of Plateumaris braccata]